MQFSPFSCHLISPRSKYPPQHPVFKHSQSIPPLMSETKFHNHTEPQAKLVLYICREQCCRAAGTASTQFLLLLIINH
jgi:hypothetical protein